MASRLQFISISLEYLQQIWMVALARLFHELLSRDHEDGRATGQPQGVGAEAYLNGTSQGPTPEDARKNGHIRGRSKLFMKQPGSGYTLFTPPWTGFRPSRIIKWSRLTWKIAYVVGKGT